MGRPGINSVTGKSTSAPTTSRARRRAVTVFCAVFVAIQVLVPLSRLPGPEVRPFGWQMFSAVSDYRLQVEYRDGSTETLEPADYLARHRPEVDYRALPEFLCSRIPDAVQIRTTSRLAGTDESHRCGR